MFKPYMIGWFLTPKDFSLRSGRVFQWFLNTWTMWKC